MPNNGSNDNVAILPAPKTPIPVDEEKEETPVYVNPKQYHRILQRRIARAKLEASGRIPPTRQVN